MPASEARLSNELEPGRPNRPGGPRSGRARAGGAPRPATRRTTSPRSGPRVGPVELGRLEITGISPTSAGDERCLIFDPTNRTDGIDLSDDPILLARSAAYSISYERRSKGE